MVIIGANVFTQLNKLQEKKNEEEKILRNLREWNEKKRDASPLVCVCVCERYYRSATIPRSNSSTGPDNILRQYKIYQLMYGASMCSM